MPIFKSGRRTRVGAAVFCGLALMATLGLTGPAAAQNVQNFRPAQGTWNALSVEGARVADHLKFVPSVYVNYGHKPLVVRDSENNALYDLVGGLVTANVMGTFGLGNRFEIGIDVPLHILLEGTQPLGVSSGFAVGDIRLMPKLRIFGRDKVLPEFGIAIAMPVSLPTGNGDLFTGEGQVTLDPKLILELKLGLFRFMANGGVRIRPENTDPKRVELGSEVVYGAAMGFELGSDALELLAEAFGAAALDDIQGAQTAPLEGLLGLRWFTRPGAVLTVGAGMGIQANYGDPEYRVLVGLAWNKRDNDRDGDGILDDVDQCPDDPEDKDGFEDLDGCPDLDNDKDGILDVNDSCPNEPEDRDDFQDEDGCPDPDNDGDGIPDVNDKCPNHPEDKDGFEDTDGCPDPDNDNDGILDVNDKCPMDPEDRDGFQDEDGCPDPDNDKDGIPDVRDKCPNEPETINGIQDEDGCPDQGKVKVVITDQKIEIMEMVYFETNKDVIKKVSYDILNQVASVLAANPQITRIRVEGHTDDRGKDDYNKDLSQRRAASVKRYLVEKGIDAARLDPQGFGEERPVDSNKTADGRARNRRVEFVITGKGGN